MFKKYCILASLVVMVALTLVACGDEANKDIYADVTLLQATRGQVVSKGFKYEFSNPQIVALSNHLGVIREGNLLEFISGRSLEDKLEGLEGKSFSLGVVKEFSPFVHFKVEQIYTETDTIFMTQTGSIDYPNITTEDKFNRSAFDESSVARIPYNKTATIRDLINNKYYVKSQIARVEERGSEVFMLIAGENKFRIVEPDDGTTAILKMLVAGGFEFEGGITLTTMEDWGSRRTSKIIGDVVVDFVKYGRMVISG
jgi:hypothetical protein